MIIYVKIDRLTGDVIHRRSVEKALDYRGLDKPFPWLELQQTAQPVFNPDTHKLVATITQPDLSDLTIDVPATAKRVHGWNKVALNVAEQTRQKQQKIDGLHSGLFRIIEDLAAYSVNGTPLSVEVLAKINTIRRLRGEADL